MSVCDDTVEAQMTTLTHIPGENENNDNHYRSSIPNVLDRLFYGDYRLDLDTSLNNADEKDKDVDGFTEDFHRYRVKNQISINGKSSDGIEFNYRPTITINARKSDLIRQAQNLEINKDPPNWIPLEEDCLFRHDLLQEGYFDDKVKKRAHRKPRYYNQELLTLSVNGYKVDAIRVASIIGEADRYIMDLMDNPLGIMKALIDLAINSNLSRDELSQVADYIAAVPNMYSWNEFILGADGTRIGIVRDASRYPEHTGYMDGEQEEVADFVKGEDWEPREEILENERWFQWAIEEISKGFAPFRAPHSAYSKAYAGGFGPHPVMAFGYDGNGDGLTKNDIHTILTNTGNRVLYPFGSDPFSD